MKRGIKIEAVHFASPPYTSDGAIKKVKEQIGYMPEGTPLYYDLTVKEFIAYMAELKLIPKKEKIKLKLWKIKK